MVAVGGQRKARGARDAGTAEDLDAAAALIRLSRLVQDVHARVSEHQGLPPVQAKMLCVLIGGPRQMTELARALGVEKAALTGLADRAESRGMVERTAVPGDRRASALSLTEAGRDAATAFHTEATAELNQLLRALTPAERERFRGAVTTMITATEEPMKASA